MASPELDRDRPQLDEPHGLIRLIDNDLVLALALYHFVHLRPPFVRTHTLSHIPPKEMLRECYRLRAANSRRTPLRVQSGEGIGDNILQNVIADVGDGAGEEHFAKCSLW